MVEGQLEEQVTALAQDIIEEARALEYDANTVPASGNDSEVPVVIPDGFSTLGSGSGENSRSGFNDFDDFDGWSDTITVNGIDYLVSCEVVYVETTDYQTYTTLSSGKSTLKKLTVSVSNDFLKLNESEEKKVYSFSFIRSYYAD
ncbi:MAG: hypothetical protein FH748_16680 [Balneolaceae bacterium]|nr:hypothetical protein [Balneolaceae bacterium]